MRRAEFFCATRIPWCFVGLAWTLDCNWRRTAADLLFTRLWRCLLAAEMDRNVEGEIVWGVRGYAYQF